jgi:hypothetical protein
LDDRAPGAPLVQPIWARQSAGRRVFTGRMTATVARHESALLLNRWRSEASPGGSDCVAWAACRCHRCGCRDRCDRPLPRSLGHRVRRGCEPARLVRVLRHSAMLVGPCVVGANDVGRSRSDDHRGPLPGELAVLLLLVMAFAPPPNVPDTSHNAGRFLRTPALPRRGNPRFWTAMVEAGRFSKGPLAR